MRTQVERAVVAMLVVAAFGAAPCLGGEKAPEKVPVIYPAAILAFQERGAGVKDYGEKIAGILFAKLATDENLILVERADIEKLIKEHELNLSGIVKPEEAAKVGQLTGAKVLITGSVIEADKTLYIVAKIIGTETSRVVGESVKGKTSDELGPLVEQLAVQVAATVVKKSDQLVVKEVRMEDRIKALAKALGDAARPSLTVKITERHVGQATVDPAAETEMMLFCKDTGFDVLDADRAGVGKVDIVITGEGFSEFAGRHGNLISVKARVEIKAVDRATDKVIAVDRQTAVAVDLSEQIAGKTALQKAAADVAERMLPKLIKK